MSYNSSYDQSGCSIQVDQSSGDTNMGLMQCKKLNKSQKHIFFRASENYLDDENSRHCILETDTEMVPMYLFEFPKSMIHQTRYDIDRICCNCVIQC